MGLFERRLGGLFSGKATNQNVSYAMVSPGGHAAFPNLKYETYVREGYQKNEVVFACIEEWATDIAEPEVRVWSGDDADKHMVEEKEDVTDLFRYPNPWMSGDDFLAAIEMYKRLAGNAYELKVRSGSTKIVQRVLLRPDRVLIIPDKKKHISRYEYRIGAEKYDLDPDDVVHHRTRNPWDDYYGMPPLMAASGSVDIFNHMKDMTKGFLQNSGLPAGILQVAGKLNEAEKALVKARFRNDYGGLNTGNIAIADGGTEAPKFEPMSMPLGARGLVVPELDEMDEARICMVFRVPLTLVGARLSQIHNTLGQSGREADRAFFTEQQLVPEWKLIASTFTLGYGPELLNKGEYFDFDLSMVRSLGENEATRSVRILSQQQMLVRSIQESRREFGLTDPQPDDIFNVPVNVIPTKWSDIVNPPQPVAPVPGGVNPDNVPKENPDGLPMPPLQKRLGPGPQVVVINAQPGEVRKLFEYDEDGNITSVVERTQ